ncbi:hypothetical protein ACVW27_004532, partial [Klebsiella pneumoniae]
ILQPRQHFQIEHLLHEYGIHPVFLSSANFNNRARLSLSFLCIAKIKKQQTALNSEKYMLKVLFIRNFRISIYRYLTLPTRYCINGKHPLDYHG